MQVILMERIRKLGTLGDIVSVKPGYARNYLLPRKKALRVTPENKELFEKRREHLEATAVETLREARSVFKFLDGLNLFFVRSASDKGHLYGSVTAKDVASSLMEEKVSVHTSQVLLHTPLKTCGFFQVKVEIHPEVDAYVNVSVATSDEKARAQIPAPEAVASEDAPSKEDAPSEAVSSEDAPS